MSSQVQKVAKTGEKYAAEHLTAQGYNILDKNFRYKRGEIDLIAQKDNKIVFVEVKTRTNLKYGLPQTAVTIQKQRKISKIALAYLTTHSLLNNPCRFDVIAIYLSPKHELLRLDQIESAFEFLPPTD